MRRDLRVVLLILALVVAPAVVLSFFAARVLENWQVVLRDRMTGDASRALESAADLWADHMKGLTEAVRNSLLDRVDDRAGSPDFNRAMTAVASLRLRYPWIQELTVLSDGEARLYPPRLDVQPSPVPGQTSVLAESMAMLRQADQRQMLTTNAVEALGEYARLLDLAALDPAVKCLTLLRMARLQAAAGQWEQAVQRLLACADMARGNDAGMPLREPDEGFYIELVALDRLAEAYSGMRRPDDREQAIATLQDRAVAMFEGLPAAQRALVMDLARPGVRVAGSDASLRRAAETKDTRGLSSLQWQECRRAYSIASEGPERMLREEGSLYAAVGEEGWQWIRRGSSDYLVAVPDRAGHPSVMVIIRLARPQLMEAVRSMSQEPGIASGIGVVCQWMDTDKAEATGRSVLAERRLPTPFERLAIAATPADPAALAASANLRKRLYGAGGFLLVMGVLAGVWVVWREAVQEIRKAKDHSEFAAAVSHDLRTPLSSMRMLAESLYLDRVRDEEKRKRFLSAILKESDRLSRLTDRALYFIRYGEGMLRYRFTEGDFGGVVRVAVETFATGIGAEVVAGDADGAAGQDGVADGEQSPPMGNAPRSGSEGEGGNGWRIGLSLAADLGVVRFDAGAIEQVVYNLLDNAVKYSGREHRIEVAVKPQGGKRMTGGKEGTPGWPGWFRRLWRDRHRACVELSVRDHGAGMDKDEVRRVMRPYTRGKTAAEAHARGVGLGLALCHHVARAHGGRIVVESQVGDGTTFHVILPAGEG